MVANPCYLRAIFKSDACYIDISTETILLTSYIFIILGSTYTCYGMHAVIKLYFFQECNIARCTGITDNDTSFIILHQAIFYTTYGFVGLCKGIKSTKQGHQCQSKVNSLHNKMLLKIQFFSYLQFIIWVYLVIPIT